MKKEISQIPLTDNPRSKKITLIPLKTDNTLDTEKENEDHKQNNPQSIQQLESDKRN